MTRLTPFQAQALLMNERDALLKALRQIADLDPDNVPNSSAALGPEWYAGIRVGMEIAQDTLSRLYGNDDAT